MLNDPEWKAAHPGPVTICGFPVDPWIGTETVIGFTPVEPADVVFARTCAVSPGDSLFWDESIQYYSKGNTGQAVDRNLDVYHRIKVQRPDSGTTRPRIQGVPGGP